MSSFFIQMEIEEIEMPVNDRAIGFARFDFFLFFKLLELESPLEIAGILRSFLKPYHVRKISVSDVLHRKGRIIFLI